MKFTLIFTLIVGSSLPAAGQSGPDEYQVKAAFLYNFVKFVEWPAATAPKKRIHIGIIGNGPAADAVEAFCKEKSINDKPLVTRRLKWDDDLRHLHIVFVSDTDSKKVQQILAGASETGALTVGDVDGFAARGGIINFFVEDSKVRFEINSNAASEAGFKISARLLSLAKPVGGSGSAAKKGSR